MRNIKQVVNYSVISGDSSEKKPLEFKMEITRDQYDHYEAQFDGDIQIEITGKKL